MSAIFPEKALDRYYKAILCVGVIMVVAFASIDFFYASIGIIISLFGLLLWVIDSYKEKKAWQKRKVPIWFIKRGPDESNLTPEERLKRKLNRNA